MTQATAEHANITLEARHNMPHVRMILTLNDIVFEAALSGNPFRFQGQLLYLPLPHTSSETSSIAKTLGIA